MPSSTDWLFLALICLAILAAGLLAGLFLAATGGGCSH
jgi:hypothetical protein